MSKHKVNGVVTQVLPGGNFKVTIEIENVTHAITASVSGKIRENKIKIVKGDTVVVIIDSQNINEGQITLRTTNIKVPLISKKPA